MTRMHTALLLTMTFWCLLSSGCQTNPEDGTAESVTEDSPPVLSDADLACIRTFCADCHAFPDPGSFPREAWKAEVAQGFRLFYDSPKEGLEIPGEDMTVAYFESLAPEHLELVPESGASETKLFQPVEDSTDDATLATAVSCVRFDPASQTLWACDMRDGSLFSASPGERLKAVARPLELLNPCRMTSADLDNDGVQELLISDLGSFLPKDHQQGSVWAFSPQAGWEARPILKSVSRVCDVQAGDFDADGDLDLVVAEFGWRRTGRLVLLWNESNAGWREQVLDERHGAIDVPVVDLNDDGRPDIITVLAQEHEMVVAYLNQGSGQFQLVTLYEAGDPSFGSSGLQVLDFDKDGDFDVLHTNGDSFDDGHLKPFHGVRWLENTGNNQFKVHELASMPGVHKALAADLDLDGDQDVVAVSLLPPHAVEATPGIASVIWLEQQEDGSFVRHLVETDQADHSSCELVDWDADGDLDLCVTRFHWTEARGPAVSWFLNQTRQPAGK